MLLRFRKKVLKVGKRLIEVNQLIGSDDIFIGPEGVIIISYWQPKEIKGKTPGQRKRAKWGKEEIHYKIYKQGLLSALRGMRTALFRAKIKDIPFYRQARSIINKSVRGAIIEKNLSLKKLPKSVQRDLREIGFVLQRANKTETKEALTKLLFLYQDGKQGLSVGAMLARNTAIGDRLVERLEGLYSWNKKFSLREKILSIVFSQIKTLIDSFQKEINFLVHHEIFSKGKTTPLQRKIIVDKLVFSSREIGSLVGINPFWYWAEFVLMDLAEAIGEIKKSREGEAKKILARILLSVAIKKYQGEISRLLLRFDQEKITGKVKANANFYIKKLDNLFFSFLSIEPQEKALGFKERVSDQVCSFLAIAKTGMEYGDLKVFKEALKEAEAVL
jgi:hypothetical protein